MNMKETPIPQRKLAIIDLDGVVANSEKRFMQAHQKAINSASLHDLAVEHKPGSKPYQRLYNKLFYGEALKSEYVSMDEPMPEAKKHLDALEQQYGFEIVFLTGRPWHMQAATESWLARYGLLAQRQVICKPQDKTFIKTIEWKMEVIASLVSEYHLLDTHQPDTLILVDDEQGLLQAFQQVYEHHEEGIGVACNALYHALSAARLAYYRTLLLEQRVWEKPFPYKTMRVYRSDNAIMEPEYITVVDDRVCYPTELLYVELPAWNHAFIRLLTPLDEPPDKGLLDNSVGALQGWHYLLDNEADQITCVEVDFTRTATFYLD